VTDFRLAARSLLRNPALSLLCISALGLGIGANAAVFAFIDKILLEPFPFPHAGRVMALETSPGRDRRPVPYPTFEAWAAETRSLEALGAYQWWEANLTGVNEPEHLVAYQVTPNLFRVLGVAPALGRGFLDSEANAGADHVVVLSHATWQRRFGGDPDILGKPAMIDGQSYTVVGVMPADFRFPKGAALWTPLVVTEAMRAARTSHTTLGVGRMRPGETPRSVQAELTAISARVQAAHPDTEVGHLAQVFHLRDYGDPLARFMMLVMAASVGLLLFLACANVANVLLARSTARAREFAVRAALGASRARLVAHLLAESLLLALGACVVGLGVGWVGIRLLRAGMPPNIERFVAGWERVQVDLRLVVFSTIASLLATFAASIYCALQISRHGPQAVLASEAGSGSPGRHRLRGVLIGVQVALALVLVTDAGLFGQTLRRMILAPLGFELQNVLTFRMGVSDVSFPGDADVERLLDEARARLRALPGVEEVGVAGKLPLSGRFGAAPFEVEGAEPPPGGRELTTLLTAISPGYVEAMRIPLREGRAFTTADRPGALEVALVSEPFARRHFPSGEAIGKRIRVGKRWWTVVGITAAVKHLDLTDAGLHVFLPLAQNVEREVAFALRTAGDPERWASSVQKTVHALAPDQPISELMPLRTVIDDNALLAARYGAGTLAVLGAIALLLSAVGVYGVMSQWLLGRLRELGIRAALGARVAQLLRLVLWRGLRPAAVGLVVGIVLALGQGRLLRAVLYGVSPEDPRILGGVALVISAVALAACILPARRALRLDPSAVLREN
jgi:putative ABC transport system permease protein